MVVETAIKITRLCMAPMIYDSYESCGEYGDDGRGSDIGVRTTRLMIDNDDYYPILLQVPLLPSGVERARGAVHLADSPDYAEREGPGRSSSIRSLAVSGCIPLSAHHPTGSLQLGRSVVWNVIRAYESDADVPAVSTRGPYCAQCCSGSWRGHRSRCWGLWTQQSGQR